MDRRIGPDVLLSRSQHGRHHDVRQLQLLPPPGVQVSISSPQLHPDWCQVHRFEDIKQKKKQQQQQKQWPMTVLTAETFVTYCFQIKEKSCLNRRLNVWEKLSNIVIQIGVDCGDSTLKNWLQLALIKTQAHWCRNRRQYTRHSMCWRCPIRLPHVSVDWRYSFYWLPVLALTYVTPSTDVGWRTSRFWRWQTWLPLMTLSDVTTCLDVE